jgi:hypothetical protein
VKLAYSSVRPQIPTSNEQSAFHSSLAKIQATETIKSNASAFIFARSGPPNCRRSTRIAKSNRRLMPTGWQLLSRWHREVEILAAAWSIWFALGREKSPAPDVSPGPRLVASILFGSLA